MSRPEISVIIPNYNGIELLPPCLDSVESQDYPRLEIIVVDDASTDLSVDYLKTRRVKLIVNEENLGFAATVNKGILSASGDYVLLLNNDVVLTPNFLDSIIRPFEIDESIFSVSSKMLRYYERDTIDDTGDMYTIFGWVYKRGDGESADLYTHSDYVFSACAGAGLYRKDLVEKLGGFDPLHESYLEDVDLGWKARINGYKNFYSADSVCYHIGSATLAGGNRYSEKKVYLSARNNIYIISKNMPAFQLILNAPTLVLGFVIKYFYFLKRGYGHSYINGIIEGIRNSNFNRVRVNRENFRNFFDIQMQMLSSTVVYTINKSSRLIKGTLKRIREPFKNVFTKAIKAGREILK